ncbi:MAG: sugar porter family MFS transporter [Polyangiaceae bacterium]|nr:sugar porter family MFS transporter [Polyangiaceae bacterium]
MKSQNGFVILIASVAAIGGFLFGFDSGVINGTVTALQSQFNSSSVGTGFSVASMLLGCALGAFIAGPFADRFGRKKMLTYTALGFAFSAWGSGYADASSLFIVFRLLGGIAVGAASVLAPAYIAEVAPPQLRGRLASLQQLAIVLGLLSAFLSNYTIAHASGGASEEWWGGWHAWRWMFWVELLPAIALFIGSLIIPETPRFLVRAGKQEEAAAVFRRIGGGDPHQMVIAIKATLSSETKPRLRDVLDQKGKVYPLVWLGMILSIFQQFVGINVVFYYGEVLWRAAGFSEEQALQVNLLSGAVNVLSTFVAIALIDRLGRKPLLLAGSTGMALSLGAVAFCFSQGSIGSEGTLELTSGYALAALVFANLYVFSFGTSWGPVVWVLLGEMFPNSYRGAALSLGAGVQWVANFAITMTFPVFLQSLGLAPSYLIYAFFAALSFVFVKKFIQETKGRSLEEMG